MKKLFNVFQVCFNRSLLSVYLLCFFTLSCREEHVTPVTESVEFLKLKANYHLVEVEKKSNIGNVRRFESLQNLEEYLKKREQRILDFLKNGVYNNSFSISYQEKDGTIVSYTSEKGKNAKTLRKCPDDAYVHATGTFDSFLGSGDSFQVIISLRTDESGKPKSVSYVNLMPVGAGSSNYAINTYDLRIENDGTVSFRVAISMQDKISIGNGMYEFGNYTNILAKITYPPCNDQIYATGTINR